MNKEDSVSSDDEGKESGPDLATFMSSYKKLSEQPATTVRFFDRKAGERYSVYGNDAVLAAKLLYQNNSVIKSFGYGSNKLDYVSISRSSFETFVRDLLLVRQYRVEVYVNTSPKKGCYDWKLEYKGSPGNLTQFEDLLLSCNEITVNNGVIGIKIGTAEKSKVIGVAHINLNECEINLVEFIDNDSLCNFESVLVQLSPKEAVFSEIGSLSGEYAMLRKILNRNAVLITEKKASDFDTKDVCQDLARLLKLKNGEPQNVASLPDIDKKLAAAGLCGAIKYLDLLSGGEYFNQFKIEPFDFGLYVKMDSAACRALHLSLNNLEFGSLKATTLTSIIDTCRTAQGHRLLSQYLKQPLVDQDKLEERLDITQILVDDVFLRQSLYEEHLKRIPDCQMLSRKLIKRKANLQDCFRGYQCLLKIPKLIGELENNENAKRKVLVAYFIDPLQSIITELGKFKELIETTIDLEKAENGDFVVRPDFDETFQELREQLDEIESDLAAETQKVAKDLGLEATKTLKLDYNSIHGYHFRITFKSETGLRNNNKYEIIASKTSGLLFRNEKVQHLNSRHAKKRQTYEDNQKDIVKEVIAVAAGYSSNFEQLGNVMASLDVFTSFAVLAANSPTPYVRPILLPRGTGTLKFEKLRHPCVESQPGVDYIPNDVHFEKGVNSFYIVTGPNMGGKSTFLRSIGVATLLAHIGCFVPAARAEISIVDAILARVGAGDFLAKGVSTFQAEMIETAFILKTATSDSLVLIDELGRGTSTCDGFGLCWAISNHLAKKIDCYCVLATHFHELALLSEEVKWVTNVHAKAIADENGITMLYKIEKGPCDKSFGLHVAEINKFPEEVMESARMMSNILEDFSAEEYKNDSFERVNERREFKRSGQEYIDEFNKKADILAKLDKSNKEELARFNEGMLQLYKEVQEKAKENPYVNHILDTVDEELSNQEKAERQQRKRKVEEDESDIPPTKTVSYDVCGNLVHEPLKSKEWVQRRGIEVNCLENGAKRTKPLTAEEIKELLKDKKILSREEWEEEYEEKSYRMYPLPK